MLYENVVTTQSDPFRRCIVALRGWQSSLVTLFAIVDVSSELNAPATALHFFKARMEDTMLC